ncbi:hypothetical protein CC1G_15231 [Coprinopsis cinerea okayama7|uniref:Secreted protein n=1 Tax=Coprinopsis cinerea (strain Okayama-7 / 130 / ATCC MYA-4618 / FGSC 9003) TaxID=240176 RepID=D6RPU8_COPC7|nr:hypothetical protein CC1G_15231 [Coprinopsis cinerea okayama7\|eukprot:XP_002910595.1 hypothetical protein CC1G_15231 [Coprinopsis cinerea okayama7\
MLDLRFWNLALLFVFVLRWGVSPGFASPLDSGASVESRGRDLSRRKELRREKELRQTTEEPKPCFFSCPPTDARGLPLVRRAGAVGPASWYDVVECVYAPKHWYDSGHTRWVSSAGCTLLNIRLLLDVAFFDVLKPR